MNYRGWGDRKISALIAVFIIFIMSSGATAAIIHAINTVNFEALAEAGEY